MMNKDDHYSSVPSLAYPTVSLMWYGVNHCTSRHTMFAKWTHLTYCKQVLFAFMVGLHNLYWYYGSQTYKKDST